jgi:hypothetical protein
MAHAYAAFVELLLPNAKLKLPELPTLAPPHAREFEPLALDVEFPADNEP